MALRIVLADDHALVRAGIRSLLEAIEGAEIVGEADDGRRAVELVAAARPDLAIVDVTMKELNGIEATARMREASSATRVLILTMHSTEEFVRRALRAGASGYLVKDSAPLELRMAIEAVTRGEVYLSPRVSTQLAARIAGGPAAERRESPLEGLSARQREILQLIVEGKTTKQAAFILDVSVKTVETHRAAIMERLGIHDVPGLVVFAIRNGLIDIG